MRCVVYVLYFDEASRAAAVGWARNKTWAVPLFLPTTVWMESDVYAAHGVLMQRYEEWRDADYVGTVAYSAPRKIPRVASVLQQFVDGTDPASTSAADVLALNVAAHHDLLDQSSKFHPQFRALWTHVLPLVRLVGRDGKGVAGYDPWAAHGALAFYNNYWLARPSWMLRYMAFYQQCRHVIEESPRAQQLIWQNSRYRKTVTPLLREAFRGHNYYPHHPFLAERLPCFFFHVEGARVATPATVATLHTASTTPIIAASATTATTIRGTAVAAAAAAAATLIGGSGSSSTGIQKTPSTLPLHIARKPVVPIARKRFALTTTTKTGSATAAAGGRLPPPPPPLLPAMPTGGGSLVARRRAAAWKPVVARQPPTPAAAWPGHERPGSAGTANK